MLKLHETEATESRVPPFGSMVGNVLGDDSARVVAVLIFGHFQFGLDRAEAGLHERVVVNVVGPAHALAALASHLLYLLVSHCEYLANVADMRITGRTSPVEEYRCSLLRISSSSVSSANGLPGYGRHCTTLSIEQYVDGVLNGKLFDPVLTTHLKDG